jgi:hypothetical protein
VDLATIEHDSGEDKVSDKVTNIGDSLVRILTPGKQQIVLPLHEKLVVEELLEMACMKRRLNDRDYYLRFRKPNSEDFLTIGKEALVKKLVSICLFCLCHQRQYGVMSYATQYLLFSAISMRTCQTKL